MKRDEAFEAWWKPRGELMEAARFSTQQIIQSKVDALQGWQARGTSDYARGVKDERERCAKIAETTGYLEKADVDDWCSKEEARCQIAVDVVVETRQQIAKAIRSQPNG